MKKQIIAILFLITMLSVFGLFSFNNQNKHEVLGIITPNKIIVDFNNDDIIDNNEIVCVENIESFTLNPEQEFIKKYSQKYKISELDIINLGYLANEYAKDTLLNKKVSVKLSKNENIDCKFGNVYIDGTNYANLLYNSGYGMKNSVIGNLEKFKKNLEISKKLNLVILNHHSNKYHTLDCKYGNIAHDKIIIPLKQLPKGMMPCNFCFKKDKPQENNTIPTIKTPPLKLFNGSIAIYKFDYTKQLKPNTQCKTEVCQIIVKSIDEANESIDIAIYGYDDIPLITNALNNAKNRGVKIRFIYDEDPNPTKNFYKGNYIIKNLAEESMSDRASDENIKIMHNKFIIIDRKRVITGSMNYSKAGLSGYDINDIVVINSEPISALYEKEFEQMIEGKFHNSKNKISMQNKFIIGDTEIEVYFSPQDEASTRIIELINNAKTYIYIPSFLITHKKITNALIQAKKRNIDVRIIIDANSVYTKNSTHKTLRANDVLLKVENYAGKLHSKTIIIDDEYLILGSMNLSSSGDYKNDENLLVIKNRQFAKNYKEFFSYLWNIIPDKYLKTSPRAESYDSIGSCNDGVDNNFDGKIDSYDDGCSQEKTNQQK